MVALRDGCVKKRLRYNSAFTLAPTSTLFSRGFTSYCCSYSSVTDPQSSIRGRTTWLMSDVGNGGPDVGIVHQLFVRLTLGNKLAAGVGGLKRVSWCRSKSARTPAISQYRDGLGCIQGRNLAVSYQLGRATSTVAIVIAFSGDPTTVSSRESRRAGRGPSLLPKTASAPSLSPAWVAWDHCAFADALCAWRLT
jgi:hypothetical protein